MKPTRRNFIMRSLGALAAIVPGIGLLAGLKPKSPPIKFDRFLFPQLQTLHHYPAIRKADDLRRIYVWRQADYWRASEDRSGDWKWSLSRMREMKPGEQFIMLDPDGEFVLCSHKKPAVWVADGVPYLDRVNQVWTVEASWHREFDPEEFAGVESPGFVVHAVLIG